MGRVFYGAKVEFSVTYAAVADIVEPKAEIPRRRPGSGIAAALMRDYAADYAVDCPEKFQFGKDGGVMTKAAFGELCRLEHSL